MELEDVFSSGEGLLSKKHDETDKAATISQEVTVDNDEDV